MHINNTRTEGDLKGCVENKVFSILSSELRHTKNNAFVRCDSVRESQENIFSAVLRMMSKTLLLTTMFFIQTIQHIH